jgi:hypothetical protein
VLFLTGDKALLDKVNAIADKINARAQKNKLLMEWANLMLIQSKIVANDIVRRETTKLLKEEKNRKEAEKIAEEKAKKEQAKLDKKEKERMASQKNNSILCTKYGVPDDVIVKLKLTKKEIKQSLNNINSDFFDEKLADEKDNTKLDDKVEINKKRFEFYKKCKADKYIKDAIEFATKDGAESPVQHFRFASYMVMNCDLKKDEYPCPIDIMIATFNNNEVITNISKDVIEPINGINKDDFTNSDIDAAKVFENDGDYKNTDYTLKCAFLYLSTISEANAILESKHSILTTTQFIAESAINAQKERLDNEIMLIDVLSDYENNIGLIRDYKSRMGNVNRIAVDENGKPLFLDANDNPIELTDEEFNELTYYIITNY